MAYNEEYAIEVDHISKSFKIFYDKGHTIKDQVVSSKRRKYEKREVLKDISFKLKRGEAIGLIGHNGCGKSTTLKLLTRIMYPDSGTITMRGRVSSLIELGAGFHPDMSGRENIYINASIFGLNKKEIDRRLDDIIAFSELEEFIDNPVRTYSSGMYMRLAFAVAINVDADILLIDEILAVGDVNFQAKCFNRLREIKAEGTTIVIVSHSLGQIEQICDRSIWIQDGLIKAEGIPYDVHPVYLRYMEEERQKIVNKEKDRLQEKKKGEEKVEQQKTGQEQQKELNQEKTEEKKEVKDPDRWGTGNVVITDIQLVGRDNKDKDIFATDDKLNIIIKYKVKQPIKDAVIGFSFTRIDGVYCYGTNTELDRIRKIDIERDGECKILIDSLALLPGQYFMDLEIKDLTGTTSDYYRKARKVEIYSDKSDVGIVRLNHEWVL